MSFTTYEVELIWRSGNPAPSIIGQDVLRTLRDLEPLNPAMSNWLLLDRPTRKYWTLDRAARGMTAFVERNVLSGDFDGPDPELGFGIVVKGSRVASEFGTPDSIFIAMEVGGKFRNSVRLQVGSPGLKPPDLSLVTYPIYKGALEVLAANWPCPWVLARALIPRAGPVNRLDRGYREAEDGRSARLRSPFETAWIAYLSGPLAAGLTPPRGLASERTPGGGLILSAARERLDPFNSEHLHRAGLLEAIMNDRIGRIAPHLSQAAELPARTGPY